MWGEEEEPGDQYDVGQVCLNGHAINGWSKTMPQFNQDYCDTCGAKVVSACPSCNKPIRGRYCSSAGVDLSGYEPPGFCQHCGKAFPWTQAKMQAALDLVGDANLAPDEIETFKNSVDDVVRETPRTQVGATRLKRILGKVGLETASAVRDVLVDIVSETARKTIWG